MTSKTKAKSARKPVVKKQTGKIGSSFDDFLKEDGTHEETTSLALKRVIAWQIESAMTSQGVTKANMATRMKTSRSQLDRLLDPDNDKVQLDTIHRAASVIGKRLSISLEDAR
jgi:antitoxin HicB